MLHVSNVRSSCIFMNLSAKAHIVITLFTFHEYQKRIHNNAWYSTKFACRKFLWKSLELGAHSEIKDLSKKYKGFRWKVFIFSIIKTTLILFVFNAYKCTIEYNLVRPLPLRLRNRRQLILICNHKREVVGFHPLNT